MAKVRINIEFENDDNSVQSYKKTITAPARSSKKATDLQALQTFAHLEKDLIFGNFFDALSDPEGLFESGSQRFKSEEIFQETYFNQVNVQTLWLEIQNALHNIRFLLAGARSYKAVEPTHDKDFSKNSLLYNIHFCKMEQFNLATYNLAKVEDLVCRLIFEATGANFVKTSAPDWEQKLTWDPVKDALKKRENNAQLASMPDSDYDSLMRLFRAFRNPNFVKIFINYRDRIAHRVSPSVDFPELYSEVEDRGWKQVRNPDGFVIGRTKSFGTKRSKAEYEFLKLYEVTGKTLEYYMKILKELKTISLLNPPVLPSKCA